MRILVVPLNWGLGHATRCIPLIQRYLDDGAEVWLGGTGESLRLLRAYFPSLSSVELAPLNIRYNAGQRQVTAMLRAIPKIICFARSNRKKIRHLLSSMSFDLIISDNCFGVWSKQCACVYITHQLHICLPKPWRWLEPIAMACHAHLYNIYKEIWVPDYAGEPNLSGRLGHPRHLDPRVKYIGPLSRFTQIINQKLKTISLPHDVVAILSGPEPQRTIFEQQIVSRYTGTNESVLIIRGKIDEPQTRIQHKNITLVSHLSDEEILQQLRETKRIISRSGYTTLMDLHVLGLLDKAELTPTPGQTEQEYLARINSIAHPQAYCPPESHL
ncbi:MAG: hypothetical protein J5612_01135 [Paludibacteraceae bacterium]|nr:hypothetical protein [Paludibacteraceae bacterium]